MVNWQLNNRMEAIYDVASPLKVLFRQVWKRCFLIVNQNIKLTEVYDALCRHPITPDISISTRLPFASRESSESTIAIDMLSEMEEFVQEELSNRLLMKIYSTSTSKYLALEMLDEMKNATIEEHLRNWLRKSYLSPSWKRTSQRIAIWKEYVEIES